MTLLKDSENLRELYERRNEATSRALERDVRSLFVSEDECSEVGVIIKKVVLRELVEKEHVAVVNDDLHSTYCEVVLNEPDRSLECAMLDKYLSLSEGLRVFIIRKSNSNLPMSVSYQSFMDLCSSINAPAKLWDFLLYMGEKQHEVEISPPPIVFRILNHVPKKSGRWHLLGCIRFVERNRHREHLNPSARWSLRQSMFYYCFDPHIAKTDCVLVAFPETSFQQSARLWDSAQYPALLSPFRLIYTWYEYATYNWRPYAVALAEEVEAHESNSLGATPDDTGPVPMMRAVERQALIALDIKLSAAQLALQSMSDDVKSWADACKDSVPYVDSKQSDELHRLAAAFLDSRRDLERNVLRIEQLQKRLRNVSNLVSTFLELNSAHVLQELAKQSQVESENMRKLAERSAQDSAKITVLTILTLTYLPLTVVSNFFSTSFVGTDADHIFVTDDWWLLVVTSLPLTLLTFYVWWVWSEISAHGNYPSWWPPPWIKRDDSPHSE
jgi:Mg2+ and Co2+ transporter CorA